MTYKMRNVNFASEPERKTEYGHMSKSRQCATARLRTGASMDSLATALRRARQVLIERAIASRAEQELRTPESPCRDGWCTKVGRLHWHHWRRCTNTTRCALYMGRWYPSYLPLLPALQCHKRGLCRVAQPQRPTGHCNIPTPFSSRISSRYPRRRLSLQPLVCPPCRLAGAHRALEARLS